MKIFGSEIWVGRFIEVIALVVICLCCYLIVNKLTGKKIWGLVAGLLPLTQPIIRDWSLQYRVDMLAVMFSVLGLWIVIRYKNSKWIYASIPIFLLGLLTKISAISGLGATCIYLLIYNRKVFFNYASMMFVGLIISFGGIQLLSGGWYFSNIITWNVTAFWTLPVIITNISSIILPLSALLSLAVFYVISKIKEKYYSLPLLFLGISAIVDFGSGLRVGGFLNYYLEFIIAVCMCATLILPTIIDKAKERYILTNKVDFHGLVIAGVFIISLTICLKTAFPFPSEKYNEEVEYVKNRISDTQKPVITENTGLVVSAGKDIYAEFFIVTNATRLGFFDDTEYVNDYKNQKFDYIILRIPINERQYGDGHFTKEIMDAINENYTLIYHPEMNFYWYGIALYESNNKLLSCKE
jgi:hypothetical protein